MNEFLEIAAAVAQAAEQLDEVSESPKLDAELLLARALDVPRSYLFAHPEEPLDSAAIERFFAAIERRSSGVPLAYITGIKEFWSMDLNVTSDTLVPRPETEALVAAALQLIQPDERLRVLDLGTGSGAIALAIASERPSCEVLGTDISEAALIVARENARINGIANVRFLHGNWTKPLPASSFEIVTCNPPYVPDNDPHLAQLKHEPRSALASGTSGLDAIRQVSSGARIVMTSGGTLLMEHGDTQEEKVRQILTKDGWNDIRLVLDLAGRPRVTIAVNP